MRIQRLSKTFGLIFKFLNLRNEVDIKGSITRFKWFEKLNWDYESKWVQGRSSRQN